MDTFPITKFLLIRWIKEKGRRIEPGKKTKMSTNRGPGGDDERQALMTALPTATEIERENRDRKSKRKLARCLRIASCTKGDGRPSCLLLFILCLLLFLLTTVMAASLFNYSVPYFVSGSTNAVVEEYLTSKAKCNGFNWTGFVVFNYTVLGQEYHHYDPEQPYCGETYCTLLQEMTADHPLYSSITIHYFKDNPSRLLSRWVLVYYTWFIVAVFSALFFGLLIVVHVMSISCLGFKSLRQDGDSDCRLYDPFDQEDCRLDD